MENVNSDEKLDEFSQMVEDASDVAGLPATTEADSGKPDPEAAEPVAEAEATEEVVTEEKAEPKSFLLDDSSEEQEEKADQLVPLEEHVKLRQRAQTAEAELEKLRSQDTQTDAENSGDDEDGFFLTKADAEKIAEDKFNTLLAARQEQDQQAEQQRTAAQTILSDELQFRQEHKDYDAVMEKAFEEGVITKADAKEALTGKSPAKILYAKAKLSLNALDITIEQDLVENKVNNIPEEEMEILSDEEAFDKVFE